MTFTTWLNSFIKKITDCLRFFYDVDEIFINDIEITPTNLEIPKTKVETYQDYRYVHVNEYVYEYDNFTHHYKYSIKPKLIKEYYKNGKYVPDGMFTQTASNIIINKNKGKSYGVRV